MIQFTPIQIGTMTLKNRWYMLAAHTGFATSNTMTERDFDYYEERAKGEAAAVTMVLAVNPEGALKGMYDAKTIQKESLQILSERVHKHDCRLVVQLFHCGRNETEQNHKGKPLLAPSAVSSPIFRAMPKEMTETELEQTKQDFVNAAVLCQCCGVDAIEISCSAGYLLSEFLSPITNKRTDQYGYHTENGMKYPLSILQTIKNTVKEFPVLIKVSGAQMIEGGYTLEDTVSFCQKAESFVDGFVVTGGWHESPQEQISYHVPLGGFADFAKAVKEVVSVPVIACNRIHTKEIAEKLLKQQYCDIVGSARAFLADAHFVQKLQSNESVLMCQSCNHCIIDVLQGKEIACAYCPETGHEYQENQRRKIATRKEVVILGGGPAGLYAAQKAAERGFVTSLYCKENKLGGQLNIAKIPPGKQILGDWVAYMTEKLNHLGVSIHLNETLDATNLVERKPYLTVLAMGATFTIPPIAGLLEREFVTAQHILLNTDWAKYETGNTVLIGGNSTGLEVACFLMEQQPNMKLTIIEENQKMAAELGAVAKPLLQKLQKAGVNLVTNTKVERVTADTVECSTKEQNCCFGAEHVIVCAMSQPVDAQELTMALMDERLSYAVVGDQEQIGNVKMALESVFSLFSRFYLA